MELAKLPINIFDFVVVGVLILGILRGRKHGMSEELTRLLKWLAVVLGCGFLYRPIGEWAARSSPFSLLACFMFVYAALALLILGMFGLLRQQLGGKLVGSDIFGRAEYYLGMSSGFVRLGCMLLAVLALLNARYFSPMEVRAMEKKENELYGKNYFPNWHTTQDIVFRRSLTGPWIHDHLGFLLITPTQPEIKELHQKEANLP